ncbi:hypothetical protein GGH92_000652 [Coemansia sp. RSA 2673]|nr:hypothetical protein H4S03_001011 [Coemansia sp. S3946]KAJ2353444.1 hypothetical protein GGH92_000652 [Coemansia sp. RSA 2673]
MDQYTSSRQAAHEQLVFDQREAPPYNYHGYSGARSDNVVAGEWTTHHTEALHPQQYLFYVPAVSAPTQYYFTPLASAQAPGPPMYHMPRHLPYYNPAQLGFRPADFVGSTSGIGYSQPRRVRCTQACNHCHRRKARCVRNVFADGSVRCDNCLRDNVACEWRKSRRRGPKPRDDDELYPDIETGGSDQARRNGSGPRTVAKSTLSIASLLNVTDDLNADDEYASLSAETKAAAASDSQQADESSDYSAKGSRTLPPCHRPAELQPPALGNLMEEFLSAQVDEELRESIIAYYTYIYSYCPSLHPSTLLRKVVAGTLCPLLEASLRASTSVFVSRRLGRTIHVDKLFTRIVTAITIRETAPTVDEMCAFQLACVGLAAVRGFTCIDTLKTAVSNLLMQLGWHELDRYDSQRPGLTWDEWVERETKRRVLWIHCRFDSHHSGVAARTPIILQGSVLLSAPCSDAEWDDLSLSLLLQGPDSMADSGRTRHKMAVAVMDALSQSFNDHAPYDSFISLVGMMQRNAKAAWVRQKSQATSGAKGKGMAGPQLLGESPLFIKYDAELRDWRSKLVSAESLRDQAVPPQGASFFGDIRQRMFLVRVRYFCINIYALGMGTLLHLANRPSFFTEAEQQFLPTHGESDFDKETLAITSLLVQKFGPTWCHGLVAHDVEPESWAYCVQCAHDLADSLRKNSDIPLDYVDMVIPFAVFISTTVLLRQIRVCRHVLDVDDTQGLERDQWMAELKQCLHDACLLWKSLLEMGSVWPIDAIADMLKLMHIDDAVNATGRLQPNGS